MPDRIHLNARTDVDTGGSGIDDRQTERLSNLEHGYLL